MGFKYTVSSHMEVTALPAALRGLLKNRILCDAELVSSSDKLPCHKVVLAAKSKEFADVFANDEPMSDGRRAEIRLYDASPEACKLLLDYMYEVEEPYKPMNT